MLAILVTVVVFVAILLKLKLGLSRGMENMPQPKGYPIIGNLLNMMSSRDQMFIRDRKHGLQFYPIYKLDALGVVSANILNPEDVELVLTDTAQNTKSIVYHFLHSWLGTGLLTSSGTKWRNRRKILTPAFHFSILQEYIKIFIKETDRLVEELETDTNKPVDVIDPITRFTLFSIGETAMGINLNGKSNTTYKDAIYKFGDLIAYRTMRPWLYNETIYSLTQNGKTEKAVVTSLHLFSDKVIAERKEIVQTSYSAHKRLAMLDLLLKYKAEGANIDDEGIREEVDTFMFEGHDTTAMAICFVLLLIANNKSAQEHIVNEMKDILGEETPNYGNLQQLKFMERCIKESLRLYPSVPFISRVAGSDIKTKTGHVIPKGCMINIQIYDMHHNPNIFPEPENFDPDRFLPENMQRRHPFAYIPFSAGSRNCIGQKFAILEMKTILCGVLRKFALEPVDKPENIKFVTDLVLRPAGAVRIKFVPR